MAISCSDNLSRKCIRLILPNISMVITLFVRCPKIGKACKTPGSVLNRHSGLQWVSFRSAVTCLEMKVTPHVAQNTSGRRSAVPDAIAQTDGYAVSQQKRKLIEQGFGWAKTVGRIRQVMVRGLERVDQWFVLTTAAYNLTRMRTLGQIRLQGQ